MTDAAVLKAQRDRFLSDCNSQEAFWTCNGTICRNVYELVANIKALSRDAFIYHVNTDHDKNDFAKWIHDVLGDAELAKRLKYVLDKDRYADMIEQRIKEYERA